MKRTLVAGIVALCIAGQASAAVIFADTTGQDNFTTANFYGINFLSGSGTEYIQSATYNLLGHPGAFFDSMAMPAMGIRPSQFWAR